MQRTVRKCGKFPAIRTLRGPRLKAAIIDAGHIESYFGRIPAQATNSCLALLATLGGSNAALSIRRLNTYSGRSEACAFAPTADGAKVLGADFPIRPGVGYLIAAPSDGVYPLSSCDLGGGE